MKNSTAVLEWRCLPFRALVMNLVLLTVVALTQERGLGFLEFRGLGVSA